jgi:hypothetical protein
LLHFFTIVQKGGAYGFYADEGSLTSTDDKNQGYTHNYFLLRVILGYIQQKGK